MLQRFLAVRSSEVTGRGEDRASDGASEPPHTHQLHDRQRRCPHIHPVRKEEPARQRATVTGSRQVGVDGGLRCESNLQIKLAPRGEPDQPDQPQTMEKLGSVQNYSCVSCVGSCQDTQTQHRTSEFRSGLF